MDRISKLETIEPIVDKETLDELLSQQRLILEMHERIIVALSVPRYMIDPGTTGNNDSD